MQALPDSVQQIADVIGREDALKLIRSVKLTPHARRPRPRCVLHIPTRFRLDHPFVAVIGAAKFAALIAMFRGETLHPALCVAVERAERDAAIRAEAGASPQHMRETATRYGLTVRRVRSIVRSEGAQS